MDNQVGETGGHQKKAEQLLSVEENTDVKRQKQDQTWCIAKPDQNRMRSVGVTFKTPRRQYPIANLLLLWLLQSFSPLFYNDHWALGAEVVSGCIHGTELHKSAF